MQQPEHMDYYLDPLKVGQYVASREGGQSRNELVEEPAVLRLLETEELAGRVCLDLGCGTGHYSRLLAERGAHVTALDRSVLMLKAAQEYNPGAQIVYQQMDIKEAVFVEESFDLVISMMALHYLADIASLLNRIASWIKPGGSLIFTVEHPIFTANPSMLEQSWSDGQGQSQWIVSHYFEVGPREGPFGLHYHHTLAEYWTFIVAAGLQVKAIVEPQPSVEALKRNPNLQQDLHRPVFLGFKCCKPSLDQQHS